MSEEKKRRGFPWGQLAFIGVVAVILRVNLPPANVSSALDLSELEKENWFTRVAGGTTMKLIVSDAIAGWQYRDLVVLRVATSERLKVIAIGLPFCKWHVYDNQSESR
jgi:hypothetical protein